MTGETEKGRSIKVVRNALPLNSNLAIAQAAQTPKTRLSGTEIAATSSVSRIADSVSGSPSVSITRPTPLLKAWLKTTTRGSSRNSARKAKATAIKTYRATGRSLVGEVFSTAKARGDDMAMSAIALAAP